MPRVPPVTTATRAIVFPPVQKKARPPVAASSLILRSVARDAHGDAHAAADAQRRQALLGVALLHLVEQRHENARPRRADRMAERDGAAIDVDLRRIPAEILVDGAGLRREGLVRLDEIEVAGLPARLLERGAARRDRARA